MSEFESKSGLIRPSRRRLLTTIGGGAALTLAAPFVLRSGRAQAQSKNLVFVTWGGTYRSSVEFGLRFGGPPVRNEERFRFPIEDYLFARGDDYVQRAMFRGAFPSPRSAFDLFSFAAGTPEDFRRLVDFGHLPSRSFGFVQVLFRLSCSRNSEWGRLTWARAMFE